MKSRRLSLLFAALFLLGSAVAMAGGDWEARRERVLRASPVTRQRLAETMRSRYPNLGPEIVSYLVTKEPRFFTQAALARLAVAREKHPATFTRLPARVLEDMHARYPHLVPQLAITFWTVIGEKAPSAVADARQEQGGDGPHGVRVVARAIVAEKYPTLPEDVLSLVRKRYPDLPSQIRRDALQAATATDATLRIDIALDALRLIRKSHPEAIPALIRSEGPGARGRAFREILAKDPQFAVAFWKMIDEKYAERLYKVTHAVVEAVCARHGARLAALATDIVTLVDAKHPSLPSDVATAVMKERREMADRMAEKFPGLAPAIAAGVQAKFPRLATDVLEAIDRHEPGLRSELRQAVERRFPGLREDVRKHVLQQHPDLEKTVDAVLKQS